MNAEREKRSTKEDWVSAATVFFFPYFFCYLIDITSKNRWSEYWMLQLSGVIGECLAWVILPMFLIVVVFFIFKKAFQTGFLVGVIGCGPAVFNIQYETAIATQAPQWIAYLYAWIIMGVWLVILWNLNKMVKNYLLKRAAKQ